MSLIMCQIEPEHLELFALEFLGPNVHDHKSSDEFDYETNRTRTDQVVCPWIWKFVIFDFVYTLASANIDQSVPNLATIYMPIRSQMSSIMGQIEP